MLIAEIEDIIFCIIALWNIVTFIYINRLKSGFYLCISMQWTMNLHTMQPICSQGTIKNVIFVNAIIIQLNSVYAHYNIHQVIFKFFNNTINVIQLVYRCNEFNKIWFE